jgi:hypothetical protein
MDASDTDASSDVSEVGNIFADCSTDLKQAEERSAMPPPASPVVPASPTREAGSHFVSEAVLAMWCLCDCGSACYVSIVGHIVSIMLFVCLLQCQPGEQSNRPPKRSFAMAIASSPTRRRRQAFGDNTSSQTDAPRERKPKANNSYLTSSIHKPKQNKTTKQT